MHRFWWNNPALKERRQKLRNNATEAERVLWKRLQRSRLGVKFRRQESIGSYIVDFYCPEKKLAIEIDGDYHLFNKGFDEYRTWTLKERGVKIIRFRNEEVINSIELVIKRLNTALFNSPS